MRYKRLARTELMVSEVGFGCWGIGGTAWVGADDRTSLRALFAARDAGINFFDTALAYGHGHSEDLLARAFGKSDSVLIASKVPPRNRTWPAVPGAPLRDVFPRAYVLASLRTTLSNLRRDAVDLYQFHAWSDEWADDPEWQETVNEIRRSGRARFIGISVNTREPTNVLRALATGLVDAVQVVYNIFDQSPEDSLFPYCRENDIGVIARVPFDEGALTGTITPDTTFPRGDFRNNYFTEERKREVKDRVLHLIADARISLDQLPPLALRFCFSHPAVSTVIPGMRTPEHVQSNAAAAYLGVLPEVMRQKLGQHRWVSRKILEKPDGGGTPRLPARESPAAWAKILLVIFVERYMPSRLSSWLLQLQRRV
jgi:aryl-alcohol dehydrogenase-like predicted oxidoreductase